MPTLPGSLEQYPAFPSRFVPARRVDVWLPVGYERHATRRFPVLYMHDGQNLFDPATSSLGVTWGIAETITRLIEHGEVPETIVVGIWSTSRRSVEYLPNRPFLYGRGPLVRSRLEPYFLPGPDGDNYLRFVVEELKPAIDHAYRTQVEGSGTSIMGSSMGGLISLYALCTYPDVFAAAGCVSTHWPAAEGIMVDYLPIDLPPPGGHRLYFDYGTETLDAGYEPFQHQADQHMRATGYTWEKDWITRKFEGAEHSERAWRTRLEIPLRFLLGNP